MIYIKSNKPLFFIIAILFLFNLALLYLIIQKKEEKKQDGRFRTYMINTLKQAGFDDQQISRYKELSAVHKQNMAPLYETIKNTKDSLYSLLQQPKTPDSTINHYLTRICKQQQNFDKRIFYHFLSLRELCTAKQRPKCDSLIQEVIKRKQP